jgi:hypothetical protein
MELDRCALHLVHVLFVFGASTIAVTPPPLTSETVGTETTVSEFTTGTTEDEGVPDVPLTEQVMDLNISVSEQPDVDPEAIDQPDVDKNRVIRDIAYYIRAHKFREYDRRYYRSADEAPTRLYEDFPKPNLRSLHWEVRKHCAASFIECLKYLERKLRLTELRREDDTVTIMLQQNWRLPENSEQILIAQNACQMALKRDDLTAVPFQGPIGKCIRNSPRSHVIGERVSSHARFARDLLVARELVSRSSNPTTRKRLSINDRIVRSFGSVLAIGACNSNSFAEARVSRVVVSLKLEHRG